MPVNALPHGRGGGGPGDYVILSDLPATRSRRNRRAMPESSQILVTAIFPEEDVPENMKQYVQINRDVFKSDDPPGRPNR